MELLNDPFFRGTVSGALFCIAVIVFGHTVTQSTNRQLVNYWLVVTVILTAATNCWGYALSTASSLSMIYWLNVLAIVMSAYSMGAHLQILVAERRKARKPMPLGASFEGYGITAPKVYRFQNLAQASKELVTKGVAGDIVILPNSEIYILKKGMGIFEFELLDPDGFN